MTSLMTFLYNRTNVVQTVEVQLSYTVSEHSYWLVNFSNYALHYGN